MFFICCFLQIVLTSCKLHPCSYLHPKKCLTIKKEAFCAINPEVWMRICEGISLINTLVLDDIIVYISTFCVYGYYQAFPMQSRSCSEFNYFTNWIFLRTVGNLARRYWFENFPGSLFVGWYLAMGNNHCSKCFSSSKLTLEMCNCVKAKGIW